MTDLFAQRSKHDSRLILRARIYFRTAFELQNCFPALGKVKFRQWYLILPYQNDSMSVQNYLRDSTGINMYNINKYNTGCLLKGYNDVVQSCIIPYNRTLEADSMAPVKLDIRLSIFSYRIVRYAVFVMSIISLSRAAVHEWVSSYWNVNGGQFRA